MSIPGFTAGVSLQKTGERSYSNRFTHNHAMGRHDRTSNLIQPSYMACITYDWVDFWLETGIVTDFGGTICSDLSPFDL